MTPEYHCFIGGRNGTANAATSACPATRRQNRNRRNHSTVAYMGGPRKEKPAVWVPTQPVRNSLLSRHKRAARRRALRFIASELRSNMLVAGWAARLPQPAPVQTPVLNRLAHVLRLELGRADQVRDRARDLENPVIRPRREREPGDRGAEQRVGALRHAAERPDVACRHVCVRIDPGPAGESLPLRHTRAIHPLPHRRARLAPALT